MTKCNCSTFCNMLSHLNSKEAPLPAINSMERLTSEWLNRSKRLADVYVNEITAVSINMLESTIPWHEITVMGIQNLTPAMVTVLDAGGTAGVQQALAVLTGPTEGIVWNMRAQRSIDWAEKYIADRVTLITEQTKLGLRETVARHMTEGLTPQGLAREIKASNIGLNERQAKALSTFKETHTAAQSAKRANQMLNERATMIARTETATAFAEGNLEGYKDAGIMKVQFVARSDADAECLRLVREYTVAESRGVIPVHPNCRCDWAPVVDL